jgi:hypothetical protein
MTSLISINQNNVVANSNNSTYTYNFQGTAVFSNHEIAIHSISMYYSWVNISATLQNNTFSYTWTVGTTVTTYTIIIPDGLYELETLNSLFQFNMIQNGTYLINALGKNVYYAEFLITPSLYKFQINTFPVPTSLPSGWSQPTANTSAGYVAFPGYPTQTRNPVVTIPSAFNVTMGFASGFATAANIGVGTNLTYNSTITPQIQPSPNALVGCSLVSNKYSTPSSLLYSVFPQVGLAQLIVANPNEYSYVDVNKGNYNNITIQFMSSSTYQPLQLLDSNLTIMILIREKQTKSEMNSLRLLR